MSLHEVLPPTITDATGRTWTYQPNAFEGQFARTYLSGTRTATLMAHQGSAVRKLLSVSGKRLATVDAQGNVTLPAQVAA